MGYSVATGEEFEVRIDKKNYGYFFHKKYEDDFSGGLWFHHGELVDFDGSLFLPLEVAKLIKKLGLEVNIDDFCNGDKK